MQSTGPFHGRASETDFHLVPTSATRYSGFALIITYILYVVVRKYLEYQVGRSPDVRPTIVNRIQRDVAFGLKYGCSLPPQLPNQWPLGIDWIRKLWRSDSEQHLLAFLCSIADGYEPRNNLFQYLLVGPRAFHVLDPKNLEAVLSTQFQGIPLPCSKFSHATYADAGPG